MISAARQPKTRKCRECHQPFVPVRALQPVCDSMRCKIAHATKAVERSAAKRMAVERKAVKARKEKLKTRRDWIKDAQIAFNSYIRARDKDKPCICCGKPLTLDAIGGGYDCGHYRSTGSAPHLRFDEFNAHGQRKVCNRHGAGRAVDYRIGLIARIGREVVEAIEADNVVRKWSIAELREIRDEYRALLRGLIANEG